MKKQGANWVGANYIIVNWLKLTCSKIKDRLWNNLWLKMDSHKIMAWLCNNNWLKVDYRQNYVIKINRRIAMQQFYNKVCTKVDYKIVK